MVVKRGRKRQNKNAAAEQNKEDMVSNLPMMTTTTGKRYAAIRKKNLKRMVDCRREFEKGCSSGSPESLDIQRRRLDQFVCGNAFVLPSIEEVLAFVAHKGPLSKRTTRVCA